jgi:type 1 glutamine amidotransferase
MTPESAPVAGKKNDPMMPVAWVRSYSIDGGPRGRVFTTTMGAASDLAAAGTRRLVVNGCYWAAGLEEKIPAESNVDVVGEFTPTKFGFNGARKGLRPADLVR